MSWLYWLRFPLLVVLVLVVAGFALVAHFSDDA